MGKYLMLKKKTKKQKTSRSHTCCMGFYPSNPHSLPLWFFLLIKNSEQEE